MTIETQVEIKIYFKLTWNILLQFCVGWPTAYPGIPHLSVNLAVEVSG